MHICVADRDRLRDGALAVDDRDDADVPFRFGDEFPFADRAVNGIDVGPVLAALDRAAQLQFLLECRRVMAPGARLAMARAPAEARKLAALAGLAPVTGDALAFVKPARLATGTPLVTVAIPAYNARFFAQALDGALAQTYRNVEVVVCDDSSDDAIASIVRSRATRVPVRYVRNAQRLGVRGNYVECFERARGEYVKFLCDDDVLAPDCVARLMQAFAGVPDLTLATSRRLRIDATGARLPDQPATLPIVERDTVVSGLSLANAMLMVGLNMIGEPSTVLFRKSDLEDQRPSLFNFDGAYGRGVIDIVMWTALLVKGDAVYLAQPQSAFRIHAAQRQHDPAVTRRSIESIRELQAAWLALGLHRRRPPHMLAVQPYPPKADGDWTDQQVRSFRLAGAT